MSNAFLAEFDAIAHGMFADAGTADLGEYRATAAAAPFAQPVAVMVDRARGEQGFQQQGSYVDVTVRVIKQPGLVLAKGGLLDIGAGLDAERFELRALVEEDESAAVWSVVKPRPVPVPEPDAP
jgi:hypothetical protein